MSSLRKWRCALVATLLIAGAGCQPTGEQALVEGDRLLQAHRAKDATPLLERAVEAMPQNAQALNRLGLAYQYTGRLEDARKQYLKALNFDRNLFDAHYNLGSLYIELGNYAEAERSLRTWLGRHPDDMDAMDRLGVAQFRGGALDAAEQSLATAVRANRGGAEAWNMLGLISVRKHRYREAQQRFSFGLKLDDKDPALHLNLAIVLHQYLADRPGAAVQYRAFLELSPNAPEAPQVRATLLQLDPPPAPAPRADATNHLGKPAAAAPAPSGTNLTSAGPRSPPTNSPTDAAPKPASLAEHHPATNPPPSKPALAVTNPPAFSPSNTIARASLPADTPTKPAVVSSPTPTNPPVRVETPSLPLPKREVVQVDEEPRPVEAHDVSPPPKPQPLPIVGWRPTTSAPPAVITNKTSESPASLSAAVPTENQVEEPKPKSFWAKVNPVKWANPVRWFKGDAQKPEPAETKPTPLEVSGPVAASTIANAGQPAPAPATLLTPTPAEKPVVESKPAPPPKPVFPRYQRRGADRLLEGDRAAAEPEFGRGSDAQQHRDWITAIAAYRQALQLDPAYFEAHYNLCIAALEQGDLNLALIASDNALLLQPDNENARLNYAVALQRSGYPLDAVEQYEKVLAKRPNDANLEIVAASLCARDLKDNARARAHYEKALALNPQHPKAQAIRQWLAGN